MPLIQIHMAKGRSSEQKRALLTAVTDAVVDSIGAPRDSVRAWITEMADTDFMAGGELLADKKARLAHERAVTEENT